MTELRCRYCNRYLGKFVTVVGEIPCPNSSCKGGNQVKLVASDPTEAIRYKFVEQPKPPKTSVTKKDCD